MSASQILHDIVRSSVRQPAVSATFLLVTCRCREGTPSFGCKEAGHGLLRAVLLLRAATRRLGGSTLSADRPFGSRRGGRGCPRPLAPLAAALVWGGTSTTRSPLTGVLLAAGLHCRIVVGIKCQRCNASRAGQVSACLFHMPCSGIHSDAAEFGAAAAQTR